MSATVAAATAWLAFALVPLGALAGWISRRARSGPLLRRMRPHAWIGYATLVLVCVHVASTLSAMGGADTAGIWLATIALVTLTLQVFVGVSLQSPGDYRPELRRWHLMTFVALFALAIGHVAFNGPLSMN